MRQRVKKQLPLCYWIVSRRKHRESGEILLSLLCCLTRSRHSFSFLSTAYRQYFLELSLLGSEDTVIALVKWVNVTKGPSHLILWLYEMQILSRTLRWCRRYGKQLNVTSAGRIVFIPPWRRPTALGVSYHHYTLKFAVELRKSPFHYLVETCLNMYLYSNTCRTRIATFLETRIQITRGIGVSCG